jgi:type II secretory pathway predicted ATPase ExeA
MYERFFALRQQPFSLLPDPDFLFISDKHREALDLLELAVFNECGFCVVSGEVGAGKTVLVRELLTRLGEEFRVGVVNNTHAGFGELMRWITAAFGLQVDCKDRVEAYRRFVDFLVQRYAARQRTLLIIDEAQKLSTDAMEELRMLSNLNSDKHLVLQVILVGQPELREKLHSRELTQFAQRVAVDYHLSALDAAQTRQYILHRVARAGGPESLFDAAACLAVYRGSGGIPRLINRICDLSLVYAFGGAHPVVTADIVAAVLEDQETGGVVGAVQQAASRATPDDHFAVSAAQPGGHGSSPLPAGGPRPDIRPGARDQEAQVSTGEAASASATVPAKPATESSQVRGMRAAPVEAASSRASASYVAAAVKVPLARPAAKAATQEAHTPAPAPEVVVVQNRPASQLHKLVVEAQQRRRRPQTPCAAALVVALALLVGVAAGWMNRDRMPQLYSVILHDVGHLNESAARLTSALMLRLEALSDSVDLWPFAPVPGAGDASGVAIAASAQPLGRVVAAKTPVSSAFPDSTPGGAGEADQDAELERAALRLQELQRETQRLLSERRMAGRELEAERRVHELAQARVQLERERIRVVRRSVADISAVQRREADKLERLSQQNVVEAPAVTPGRPEAAPLASFQVENATALSPPPLAPHQGQSASPQRDGFLPDPCKGPTASFMTTCFF